MQKILRLVTGGAFLLFIILTYFNYHPYYLNMKQLAACPAGGALLCARGISWEFILLVGVIVFGFSLYAWLHKDSPEVKFQLRPATFFGFSILSTALLATLYFVQSSFASDAKVHWFSAMFSLLGHWGQIAVFLLLFLFGFAVLGYRLLQLLKLHIDDRLTRVMMGIALGMAAFIWVFAILGQFSFFSFWPIVLFGVFSWIFAYPFITQVWKDIAWDFIPFSFSYNTISWFLLTILMLVIGYNVIDLTRPFPIGWDDLGVYMNFPRQIALAGSVLSGYSGQGYMLVSALGFVLAQSTTLAMFMSWFGGILAVMSLYAFGKQFVSKEVGLLMATVMYLLPMVMHQSFADMKTDMPLFFFIITAFIALFLAWKERLASTRSTRLYILAGVLFGTALAIKITTAIALFPLLVILAWRYVGRLFAFVTFAFLNALYFYAFVPAVFVATTVSLPIALVSFVVAVIALVFALFRRVKITNFLRSSLVFGGALLLIMFPWLLKNWSETHTFSINTLLYGGPSATAVIDWQKIGINPGVCIGTATQEELGRYISRDEGLSKYAVLPWDMTMNVNQAGFYVDIGYLFLAFIPLLLLMFANWWSSVVMAGLLLVALAVYVVNGAVGKELVTWLPLFLFAVLVPQAIGEQALGKENLFWRYVVVLFGLCWYFWIFVASGVPWYGVSGFLFALLLVGYVWSKAASLHKVARLGLTLSLIVFLLASVLLRETKFGTPALLSYAFGLRTSEEVLASTNAQYPAIIKALNSDITHPIYRIGTFINYFIDNNRERVFDDAQLDAFTCIDGDGKDNARTLARLKQLNFHYLVFDTNTATIEKNKNGTLHQKVSRFMDFATTTLKVIAPKDIKDNNSGIILFEIR